MNGDHRRLPERQAGQRPAAVGSAAGASRDAALAVRRDHQRVGQRPAGRVADRAVQVFGGRGYMRENVAERFFRELRVERIWEGASEVQRLIIADQLAKRGRSALV